MTVRIEEESTDNTIPAYKMCDGQIGVITDSSSNSYRGEVVQRIDKALVRLGYGRSETWNPIPEREGFRVRILPNGTRLVVEDNE
jgi:hypothetical protein